MPMTTILVVFLMFGAWSLVSATQQWSARRDAHAVAAAAARAGAQGDATALRSGGVIDEAAAVERAEAIIAASGYSGDVSVDGETVTVTVSAGVGYAFPAPGFPESVSGSATAVAQRGTSGKPSSLVIETLASLAVAGWQLMVRADFDDTGVTSVNTILEQCPNAAAWRMNVADYLSAISGGSAVRLRIGHLPEASWDPQLRAEMVSNGFAAFEEAALDQLVDDVTTSHGFQATPAGIA